MEGLLENQAMIYENIIKIGVNIKKDSADRKTSDYFKRRLSILEQYWSDFQSNHANIKRYADKSHPYFTELEHAKTFEAYQSVKALIEQQSQQFLSKLPNPSTSSQIHKVQEGETEQYFEDASPVVMKGQDNPGPVTTNQGTNSKLDDMMRKQYANFKAFVRTAANIEIDSIENKWEYEDALKSLQNRWSNIDSLHWEIDIELAGTNEEYETLFNKYEKQYNLLKRAINTKMCSVVHREKSTPKLDIPVFTGNYNQWVSFRDLFSEAIHNNNSLSNGQKMQFLKGKVRGEAERLIQHLQISTDNYLVCWEILNHRYNNKKLIFSSHMNILLGLPSLQQPSLQHIKKIHDTTLECLNAIKNLGIDTSTWDPMIVHILCQKLDSDTFTDYIESLKNSKELPVLKEFLEFLEGKFTSLETVTSRRREVIPQKNNNNQTHVHAKKYQFKSSNSNNYSGNQNQNYSCKPIAKTMHASNYKCPLCNKQHGIYNCKTYLEMPDEQKLKTAYRLKLCINCLFSHNGSQCTSTKTCQKCSAFHNTILHDVFTKSKPNSSGYKSSKNTERSLEHLPGTSNASQQESSEILLATAIVNVENADGIHHPLRALIDQGSQISLITEKAAQLLGVKRQRCKGIIYGVGEKENNCKGMMEITCSSTVSDFTFNTEVYIMNNLIKNLPNKTLPKPSWPYLENINLADPEFYKSRSVDLLLGADVYANIMLGGIIKVDNDSQPIAQQTHLGWLLCGNVKTYHCHVVLNNIDAIKKFWEIEEVTEQTNMSLEEQECMDFYSQTTKRNLSGRYVVRIPFKKDMQHRLGASKPMALAQFRNLERKLAKHRNLGQQYKDFMREYITLGHMKLSTSEKKTECYLPHHGVEREESTTTKYRVVFNASAKTTTGYSLNDIMHKGPNLQQDLQSLLLRWRLYPIAFTADIEKMYRQIPVADSDQHLQKIVWRDSLDLPIQTYQLTTVTYGTKAAPFLAMMTLRKLAQDEQEKYPEASRVVDESFYMDDLVHGVYDVNSGKKLIADLTQLLQSGGFNLRKWSSNNKQLLENITEQNHGQGLFNFKTDTTSKTLGLCWNAAEDVFEFNFEFTVTQAKLTKRNLLSEISKLFDPLGWLTPFSTKLKLLFQKLWKDNIHWDEQVPDNIRLEWSKLKEDKHKNKHFKIPRWIHGSKNDIIELHGFCDASMDAYACVVYSRVKHQQNIILVAAKAKLVPYKKAVTLPRLELCGALLLAKLMNKIRASMNCATEIYGWCDSMVVLGWLQGEPSRWKTFVANRVQTITNSMPTNCWHYVKSSDNPADCASRGLNISQLMEHSLWFQGPYWLQHYNKLEVTNPILDFITDEEARNIKQSNIIQQSNTNIIDYLLKQHNSFYKITRVLAWILRALTPVSQRKHLPSYLTLRELRYAKSAIVKHEQIKQFGPDINNIRKGDKISNKSQILNLNPFIDQFGLLRVGGRLSNANMNFEAKHPKIIAHNSRLAELLIDEAHLLTFHGGPRLTLATLRQQYWITGGYNAAKKQIRKCVICRKHDLQTQNQLMGDLPWARTNRAAPFYHTGVDYTGFMEIKINKGRGVKTSKGYVAVFVCMVTKAIHLELVSDLTTSAFLAALKRMAARRGTPHHLYSDQGTNFIGANRMLQEEIEQLQQIFGDNFLTEITAMNIEWHFNAPAWPSAGGLWERAVKSLKFHLKRVVGEQKLTFEEFTTLLAQLEACLNSRPLCSLTENVEDLDYLSPAHFLTGRADLSVIQTKEDARTRWHLTNELFKDIWKKWKLEYLSQLTARQKWFRPRNNIKIGDLVVIREDNIPSGKWLMGRVVDVHPGNDGYVRVVTLKTKNGILKRPVVKLSILPLEMSEKEEQHRDPSSSSKPDTNKKHSTTKPPSKRTHLSSVAMALLFFLTLSGTVHAKHDITRLGSNQSLYFDPVKQVKMVKDTWTLVVYYNMAPYWEGITTFQKAMTYLNKTCETIGDQCNLIVPQLSHEFKELQYYNMLLITQQVSSHERRRRGLVNGIGYLANSLFGVLDERFAEKYTQDIDLIKLNEKHLIDLWKNQTSIVESEYNLLKRTEELMAKQHKIINQHLTKIYNMNNKLQLEIDNITLLQHFTLMSLAANNLYLNLKRSQDLLLEILTDIHHGDFNMHLLTPQQIEREIRLISSQLSADVILPVRPSNIQAIYQLIKIKSRITSKYFIFEITFPLVNREEYRLYKVLPIPHQMGKDMIQYTPIAEYIATDLKKDTYLTLTATELSTCVEQEKAFLCDVKKSIYHLSGDNNFCQIDHQTEKCKLTQSKCQSEWIPLANPSLILYHVCGNYTVKIICNDRVDIQSLDHAGIIYIENGCLLKGLDFTLQLSKHLKTEIQMSADVYAPQLDQINYLINTSLPWRNIENLSQTTDLEDALKLLHSRISEMKKSQTELAETYTPHNIHHYVVNYLLVGVVATAAAALLWRCKRRRREHGARISRDIELQPASRVNEVSACVSEVIVNTSECQNQDVRQPSAEHSEISNSKIRINKSCSPIQRKRF